MADLNDQDEKAASVISRRTRSSQRTRASQMSVSSAAARARAKAEAAQARVSFATKELEIKKERARLQAEALTLDATLEALHVEEEAAAANAEAEILEAAAAVEEDLRSIAHSPPSRQSINSRISEYVQDQAKIKSDVLSSGSLHENTGSSPPAQHEVTPVSHSRYTDDAQFSIIDQWTCEEFKLLPSIPLTPVSQSNSPDCLDSKHANAQHYNTQTQSQPKVTMSKLSHQSPIQMTPNMITSEPSYLTPIQMMTNMLSSEPSHQTPIQSQSNVTMSKPAGQSPAGQSPSQSKPNVTMPNQFPTQSQSKVTFSKPASHSHPNKHVPTLTTHAQTPNMTDFAQYLARRELVNTGLTKFDDRPENFRAWESSFFNVIGGLGLSASEELDLLTSWLGKESSVHALRIRSVYISNPYTALRMVWARLRECYCAPEVIEQA